MQSFSVSTTDKACFVDITSRVSGIVRDAGVERGLAVVFVPHTTAGITINENADPSVRRDIIVHLDKAVPVRGDYDHEEGNSPAHVKASMMGSSVTVIVAEGRLVLGIWQGIYLCEFDGPRVRTVHVEVTA